jgi:D-alanyl-D-alanine carboxypeptidase/D-alanyl-D-alanine-endopeptidase (penicillin-binding protein 4)
MFNNRICAVALLFALTWASIGAIARPQQAGPPKPARHGRLRADIARFRARVEAILANAKAEKGHWAVVIVDAETGKTLYDLNPQRYFTPASNAKLFTTALAMAVLSPDYRFQTTIETRGVLDRYGRLRGDLSLVGRGDPNLSNRRFPYHKKVERDGPAEKILAELADAIVARGIKQIEGDIIADDSYFDSERYPSGWAIEDMTFGYGAPVSAIAVNDNTLEIEVRPGERLGDPAWFGVEPWADFYQVQNEIKTAPASSEPAEPALGSPRRAERNGALDRLGQGEAEGAGLRAEREPGSRRIVLRGSIALNHGPLTLTLAVEEPAEHAAALLKRLLEARGVRVYGVARARHAPEASQEGLVVLAEHTSVPLVEAVRVINKISQNLHAELLLRAVGRQKTRLGSTAAGLKVAQEFWSSIGIEEDDLKLSDGSGLSRRNLVTPRAVVKLLHYVAQQPWGESYLSTLPVAGEDGTLAERMKEVPAAGRIRAKTGTLGSVTALSGFATTVNGARLIFSIFGNHHNLQGKDATDVVDALCLAMVEELGAPHSTGETE